MPTEAQRKNAAGLVGDLVCSMLAVNQMPLDRVCRLRGRLAEQGLFDAHHLAEMTHAEVYEALRTAGYDKADYVVGLLVQRLQDLGRRLCSNNALETLFDLSRVGGRPLDDFLLGIKGVGPVVLQNFHSLSASHDDAPT